MSECARDQYGCPNGTISNPLTGKAVSDSFQAGERSCTIKKTRIKKNNSEKSNIVRYTMPPVGMRCSSERAEKIGAPRRRVDTARVTTLRRTTTAAAGVVRSYIPRDKSQRCASRKRYVTK